MAKRTKDVVLSVEHVSKNFHLPHEKHNSIKTGIVNIFKPKNKEVDTQHALKDISFEIKKGEFFGILGRNGSGKSTLLKILAEIYQPTAGSVNHYGKLVPFIELGVGFNPELTGRENVYLNGALLGFSRKEIDARYDDIVKFAELEEFMDQKLKNYSSGMQVRLAFSVATRAEADILLVDEVLAVGDADFQRKCFKYFKSLKNSGKTVVFVTHDMSAVREYCDKAILINEGHITHQGEASVVANEYLKLFNKSENASEATTNSGRWGTHTAKMGTIRAEIVSGKAIRVSVDIENRAETSGFVVGFRIKNSEGKLVAGFNSEDQKLLIKEGQTVGVVIDVPFIFGNDIFSIDATLRQSDGVTICDNWDDAASFSALRNTSANYSIIPPVAIKIK